MITQIKLTNTSNVSKFKDGIKVIRKELGEMNNCIESIDKDFFSKASKSLEVKSNYFNALESVKQFKEVKRVVERVKKIETLISKDILSVAFHEMDLLKQEVLDEKMPTKLKEWLWSRIQTLDDKIIRLLQKLKTKILADLEDQEISAGTQVLDEVKRFVQILGKQFMLESDMDNRELSHGQTVYTKNGNNNNGNNSAAQYMNMKRSQVGFSFYKSGMGALGGMQPKFQDRSSLAQIAFSRIGNLPKYDTPRNGASPGGFSQVLSPGQISERDNTAQYSAIYSLEAIQKQAVVTQDIMIDIDFAKIDSVRKLFSNIEQENQFINFIQNERIQRILKLSKLPRSKQVLHLIFLETNVEESLARLLGFFVVQIHLTFNLSNIFHPNTLQTYWENCLLQMQKSLESIVMDYDYQPIIQTKKEIVNFVLGMRDLGIAQDLSFLNTLIKLHDVFIDKLLSGLEKQIDDILEYENYEQISVKNSEELFKTVDKYELDLSKYFGMNQNMQLSYPVLLPYSSSVVKLNDLVEKFLQDNFLYWQFLLADKADFTIAYSSCDRILCRTIELLSEHFFHKNKFTILQRAQFCSNLHYFLQSFGFFKKIVFQLANQGAYNFNKDIYGFQFSSENIMNHFKIKCEESIFTELRQKINDFLSIFEGLPWRPKKPDGNNHEFVEDLVLFLRSTIVNLDYQNKELAKQCYLTTFQHLSARITEVLANSKTISQINQAGFINLYQDYLYLTKFAKEQMVDNQQMFEIGMGELQQLISLFTESQVELGVKEILDDDLYRKKYSKINLRKLVLILEKFKDDKVSLGSTQNEEIEKIIQKLPKIKKSDAQSVAKKLRESINFQK
ncbi:exocyst complex component 6 isoform 2 [Stylonychia lemnae]|uniref:Exocyst complex component 6 isoform 2 n=1 Tax=Stylonychia lemnae TaxID=5949 RepID=A0A078AZ64_STYLE|nr:exocyst complex component 6 isoform 2 [Stylonychia lemnae]|eukprot:CDW87391.1 exocyst complex component 6 isoform 2 [Stylonychia lemnae]